MIKILVVDDEAGICHLIEKTLAYSGFSVFKAKNASKALQIIAQEKPSLIFLDILMPDVDGLELLKQIKAIDSKIVVIMVSVQSDEATRQKAKDWGADGFVAKPFEHEHLHELIMQKLVKRPEAGF